MRGVMLVHEESVRPDADALVAKARALRKMDGTDLASVVSTKERYEWKRRSEDPLRPGIAEAQEPCNLHVVAYDYGIKQNILHMLGEQGCRVTVVPARTSAEDVLSLSPDGVFLSNGPGDPEPLSYANEAIRKLAGRTPIFGICLGHQLIGQALGGKTFKLKFGHHGGNHPVKQLSTGRVEITSQNHNYAVDPDSLDANEIEQTVEGLRHRTMPLVSVQYHPEASPGPHDSHYLFDEFRKMMDEWKGK